MPDGARIRWIWLLLIATGAVLLRLSIGAWPVDDAYITFRHSWNILDGAGFVFNPGQAVLGTSAPLYGLLLALVGRFVTVDIVQVALVLNAVADGFLVIILGLVGRRHGLPTWAVLLLGLLWTLYPLGIRYSVGGMEASLAGALLLATYVSCLDRQYTLAGGVSALLVLLRPELILVVGVLGADVIFRQRARSWPALSLFVLIGGCWVLFATATYGSPLPQSVQAKTQAIYTTSPWQNTRQIRTQFTTLVSNDQNLAAQGLQASDRVTPSALEVVGLGIVAGLCLLGIWAAQRAHPAARALFGGVAAVMVTYGLASFRGSLIAEWYLIPLTPIVWLAFVGGLAHVAERVEQRWLPIVWLTGGVLLVIQLLGLNLGRDQSRPWWTPRVIWVEREGLYEAAAAELRSRVQPGDVVAAPEIGALGYFCDCVILDTVGLVSPQALKHYPLPPGSSQINNAIPVGLVREEQPKYVVTLDVFARDTLLEEAWFHQHYRAVWERPARMFYSEALIIFERIPDLP